MLKDTLLENRTCRTFDESRIITRDELVSMIECARLTPSTANIQPLCYRLVYEKAELSLVQPLTKWGGSLPELRLPPEGHRPTAFIVICQDTAKFGSPEKFQRDVGICALAISLRAAEMGLASCMIGSFDKEKLPSALGLAENIAPLLVIGIGKPDEKRMIVEAKDGVTRYYRDSEGVHYVPKRPLSEIIIN
jgi:nitroreductase